MGTAEKTEQRTTHCNDREWYIEEKNRVIEIMVSIDSFSHARALKADRHYVIE